MNLKYISYLATCLITIASFMACNNSDNETTYTGGSSDAQIKSFGVDAVPFTKADTIAYPALAKTPFSITNEKDWYRISNLDSLPYKTEIRGLKVTLAYSTTPSRIDLVYDSDSKLNVDSWNTTDSVQFKRVKLSSDKWEYQPKFVITALDNSTTRTYLINFLIHQIDPNAIVWIQEKNFALPKVGDNKTIISNDKLAFYSLVKEKNAVYFYTSEVAPLAWSAPELASVLPTNTVISSFMLVNDSFVVLDEDGNAYTSPTADGVVWTKHDSKKINALVGILPQVVNRAQTQELLVSYTNDLGVLTFAKTTDFSAYTDMEVDNKLSGFPEKGFCPISSTIAGETFLTVIGGTDKAGTMINTKPWIIKRDTESKLNIMGGSTTGLVPFKDGITAFAYDEQIYALSSDSLSLYYSNNGNKWAKAVSQQALHKDMGTMNKPSIVVDKDNYVWVFGGTNKTTKAYSQQVWRGRINRLIPKE